MNNARSEVTKKFRSVLPHEALPTNEEYGYVRIQGGFTPKVVVTLPKEKEEGNVKDETEKDDEIPIVMPSIEYLKSVMMDFFQGKGQFQEGLSEIHNKMVEVPPYKDLLHIEIEMDDGKNDNNDNNNTPSTSKSTFTKARLYYPNPEIARDIMTYVRTSKLTPNQIFQSTLCSHHDSAVAASVGVGGVGSNKNTCNGDMSYYSFQYSSKAIQASQVTQNNLPPSTIAWPKVGPPKFRRLLPNQQNCDEEKLALERSQTRFLFMTNIIDDESDIWNIETNSSTSSICDIHGENSKTNKDNERSLNDYENILNPHFVQDAIRNALQPYCTSEEGLMYPLEVYLISKQSSKAAFKYCHIGTRSTKDVQALINALQGKQIELSIPIRNSDNEREIMTIKTGKLFVDHAAITHRCEAKLCLKGNKEKGEPPRPDCTSTTKSIIVPGLTILEEFVTSDEEQAMLSVLNGPNAPWAPLQSNFSKTGSVKRRVQHYGYVFDYETADVLRDRDINDDNSKACCPPMPSLPDEGESKWNTDQINVYSENSVKEGRGWDVLAAVVERVRRQEFVTDQATESKKEFENDLAVTEVTGDSTVKFPFLNQMTVNEYKRGQGIGSHVDTRSAFAGGLISVSLGADCVMEFTETKTMNRKLVHLPPRSLLLMSGPARYLWEHMIVSRGTDCVNGKVIPRKTRTSLTLRTAITLPDVNNIIQPLSLVASNNFPPRWGNQGDSVSDDNIATPLTEKQHVHAVYDAIAKQWHHTRGKRGVLWPGATSFLKGLPRGSIVADVGCGDGKYFPAIWNAGSYVIGTDISLPLLETSIGACVGDGEEGPEVRHVSKKNSSLNSRPPVAVADCMNIPLRSQSCDAAICIAVMHHLSTRPRRLRCLKELARIVKKGGTVNVQAWAYEQENNSKRKFAGTDVFVPFNSQPRYLDKVEHEKKKKSTERKQTSISSTSVAEMYSEAYDGAEYDDKKGLVVFQRYCHMYKEGELESLVSEIDNLEVLERGFETGNHFVIFKVL